MCDHRLNRQAGIKYIVDYQQAILLAAILNQVVHAMNTDLVGSAVDPLVRGCTYRNMIGFDTEPGKQFLHRDTHRCATTPDRYHQGRAKTILDDLCAQPE